MDYSVRYISVQRWSKNSCMVDLTATTIDELMDFRFITFPCNDDRRTNGWSIWYLTVQSVSLTRFKGTVTIELVCARLRGFGLRVGCVVAYRIQHQRQLGHFFTKFIFASTNKHDKTFSNGNTTISGANPIKPLSRSGGPRHCMRCVYM